MFQFTHFPRPGLCVQPAVSRHHSGGVAPFGVSGLMACMQLPLNVSPVSASFIGLERRGIHLVLYVACSLLVRSRFTCSPHSLSSGGGLCACVTHLRMSPPARFVVG